MVESYSELPGDSTNSDDSTSFGDLPIPNGNIVIDQQPTHDDHDSSSYQNGGHPVVFPFIGLPNITNPFDMDSLRCSMPSLSKMPTTARHIFSSMFSFFHHSPSAQASVGDKSNGKHAPFSTPQADRKNQVGQRRMSDTCTDRKKSRVKMANIEKWEPDVYEKELLRRTWSDEFDFLYDLGSAIYKYIFANNPNCKKLFPFISKYEGDAWMESKEFRSQALKFVQTLAQTVKNLYHMDRLEPYLYGIGQRHCKFADRGFKAEYWDIFQDAMEHSLENHMNSLEDLTEQQKVDAVRVWRTLALYVTVMMKNGFQDGLKGINKHKSII